jgi:uncharacterized membrane protein YphA (DoxX/SURF4 family)
MKMLQFESRKFFVFGVRILFGIWLLYAGLFKWFALGPVTFVGFITTDFDNTWSPHFLNIILAWAILAAEIVLPIWILSGKKPRLAWSLTTLFMFMLVAGQTLLMKPDVIGNWQYLILTLACAALSEPGNRPDIQTH